MLARLWTCVGAFESRYTEILLFLHRSNSFIILHSFNQPPTFGILEGESAFQAWKAGSSGRWLHDQKTEKGSYVFTAPSHSEYYFIFYTRSWNHAKGQASFQVEAVTYSITGASEHCPAGSKNVCVFPLSQDQDAHLLFVAPTIGDSYTMTYCTSPRRETYAAVFASLSSAVGVCVGVALIAWCGQKCCRWVCGSRGVAYEQIPDTEANLPQRRQGTPGSSPEPPYNPAFAGQLDGRRQVPSAPPPYSVLDPNAR